uniref:L1 transposable element RRM domain-containing protein n=1 Tax=Xiphophorus maculatus TaxID=8083 RepID=A0A3B5Q2F2_XIPMA
MSGDKNKKGRVQSRNSEMRHESKACGAHAVEEGDKMADEALPATISSLRKVVSEVMAEGMRDLKSEMKKELAQVRTSLKEEIKVLLNELTNEINQRVSAAINKTEEMGKRLGEMEKSMAEKERWDIGVRDAIVQLLNDQKLLREKITDLEGRSRRNNLRVYGIPENAEGTSMQRYMENMLKTELGDSLDLGSEKNLGIERAHRALGAQPPAGAPPRSTVVRFLKFNVKEQILRAAWKRPIYIQEKRIFFDHDYAENIQLKRREYAPVKKALKENAIRFQTPMAKMRVHFDSGMVIYSSAEEAALDLRRRGFTVGPVSANRSKVITAEAINNLLSMDIVGPRRVGSAPGLRESAREKLKVFQRPGGEDVAMVE